MYRKVALKKPDAYKIVLTPVKHLVKYSCCLQVEIEKDDDLILVQYTHFGKERILCK